jgi:hypothetical protein
MDLQEGRVGRTFLDSLFDLSFSSPVVAIDNVFKSVMSSNLFAILMMPCSIAYILYSCYATVYAIPSSCLPGSFLADWDITSAYGSNLETSFVATLVLHLFFRYKRRSSNKIIMSSSKVTHIFKFSTSFV